MALRTLIAVLCLTSTLAAAQSGAPTGKAAPELVVAADGSGEFATIQAALDTIPRNNRDRVAIRIRDGYYSEKLLVNPSRITLIGQSRQGVRIAFDAPHSEYQKRYDDRGPAVLNVFGDDVILSNLTVVNAWTGPRPVTAQAVGGRPSRLLMTECDLLSSGTGAVSLWNDATGMAYFSGCDFYGGPDVLSLRGSGFVRDSRFRQSAAAPALFHGAPAESPMRLTLIRCAWDGVPGFMLGRSEGASQLFLLDAIFSGGMADSPIDVADNREATDLYAALVSGQYFVNAHRRGGADYAWHADNLAEAPGSLRADRITPGWTFGGQWDPERTDPPAIVKVEREGERIAVTFSEDVTVHGKPRLTLAGDATADYTEGSGGSRLLFLAIGNAAPRALELNGGTIEGCLATVAPRPVPAQTIAKP